MNYYILFNEHFDMKARKLVSTAVIKREGKEIYQNGFIGKILNSSFRLNFNERERNTPRNFRCSDLLDEHTYWEYDCGEGYIAGRFYMWNEKLVFSKSKGADVQLILIDMPTGIVDWEVEIPYGSFFFDEQNGMLTSVWGSKKEGGEFQIIHLDKRLVEIGRLEDFNMEYVRVNWQTQYLENNKYYFTETVYTTSNERPRPIKFGRFDIETKKIDFLQEVPGSAGHQFAQVIYHDSKLYLRSSANELFILGEENSAMHLKV
ncbi:hypothetical protein [Dyadobacter jiangsuensis]|nr:hypothetical protein [Dyadobacter jiangsuensis]